MIHQVEEVGDVAEALRHLLALGVDDEPVVHPMVGKPLAQGDGLSALVLVVRELEVHPTAMQIEALTEDVEAHHHALAVPAGPAVTPRRRPRRLTRLGQLPQHEVGGMALVLGTEHLAVTAAFDHVGEALVDQQAVVLHRLDIEVDAVVGRVAAADVDQLADHRHHLLDVLGGVRHVGRPGDTELAHGLEPHRLAFRRDVLPRPVLVVGPVDDRVVDVGDVADQSHVQTGPLEVTTQNVVDQRGSTVTEVRRAVHRRATQIDAHRAGLAHGELTYLSGGGVVQVQHGPPAYVSATASPRMNSPCRSNAATAPITIVAGDSTTTPASSDNAHRTTCCSIEVA